ncbi:MAG TPA: DUF501 domain-containing protein [Candidatus Wallbacteria bacterium]|nr:DUF501 domain-containing protein [Candidatus Wallbacteria bacterium]
MADVTLNLSQSDITIVKYQIDRNEIRFLSVSRRCKFANPLVIAQDPFFTRGILFPTIYHLSCPRLVKLISHLEASPFFKELKNSIKSDAVMGAKYLNLMNVYRQNLKTHIDFLYKNTGEGPLVKNYHLIVTSSSGFKNFSDNNIKEESKAAIPRELYENLIKCGLAGSREITAVKCLHALYGFLLGVNSGAEEITFFRNMIEDQIKIKYSEEFKDIFIR